MVAHAAEIEAMESTAVDIEVLEDIADAVHNLWLGRHLATHSQPARAFQFREYEEELRGHIRQLKLDAERQAAEHSA